MRTVKIWTMEDGRLVRYHKGLAEAAGLGPEEAAVKSAFCRKKRLPYIVSLTGAGGKTAVMYRLAEELSAAGFRTAVTTTTHILRPDDGIPIFISPEIDKTSRNEFRERLKRAEKKRNLSGGFIVAGTDYSASGEGEKKLASLPPDLVNELKNWADFLLVEADGSRRLPLKVPADWEPVILPETSLVIGCAGLNAVGKPWREVCFRPEYAGRFFTGDIVTEESTAAILTDACGTKKDIGNREYRIVLNQGDEIEDRKKAERILSLVEKHCTGCLCTSFSEVCEEKGGSHWTEKKGY
ncbi:selenium cofactor biosynthesis protein YqeC [Clostridium sp. AM58-1XD]|uniref:selenium cofactor biosynthesis protein YqeC n=1 Tax=Clostridium sp. AM58-1XD TaxID=2292307 RepID=UPI000E47342B|nr:selenium cofactor biosynthesis protein YqeC [Clostridium sp. AM58-1XD]RGY95648.1 putative selenium-dependent hydroxylase accessory protein YqeC [Clostridium sp. AM58-1XD]